MDLKKNKGFWLDIYYCDCFYDCAFKYVCGAVSLFFIVVYALAVYRIIKRKDFQLDIRDKLLLYITLSETLLIFLYYFFSSNIMLFLFRIDTMLQQLLILFIVIEISLVKIKIRRAFYISLGFSIFACLIVMIIALIKRSDSFLSEKSRIWYITSVISLLITIVSFGFGFKLIQNDSRFTPLKLEDIKKNMMNTLKKHNTPTNNEDLKN